MALKFDNTLIENMIFNGVELDVVKMNGITVFEKIRKVDYSPEMVQKIVSPYGTTASLTIEEPQTGGEYDANNITVSGSVPISSLSLDASTKTLSFNVSSCDKGLTSTINVPVINCDDYFDYTIPVEISSCTHPNMTYYAGSSASCTTSGTSAYYKCPCSSNTLNSSGNIISTYIAPLGHSYTSQSATSTYLATSASCTSAATYYYKCSRCSEKGTNTYSYGSALGHNFNTSGTVYSASRQLRTSATCTAAATYWCECSRCTVHSSSSYFSYGSALGHSYNSSGVCSSCSSKYPVTITSHPSSVNVKEGTTVSFSVSASGMALSYQWQYMKSGGSSWSNSTATGCKTSSITFPANNRNGYKYRCVVTSANGLSATSQAATLTSTS